MVSEFDVSDFLFTQLREILHLSLVKILFTLDFIFAERNAAFRADCMKHVVDIHIADFQTTLDGLKHKNKFLTAKSIVKAADFAELFCLEHIS